MCCFCFIFWSNAILNIDEAVRFYGDLNNMYKKENERHWFSVGHKVSEKKHVMFLTFSVLPLL